MHIHFIEIPAPDLAAAKQFYGEVFGWTFQDYGGNYVDFHGAGIEGGFDPRGTPARQGALIVLLAADLDAAEAKVTAAGAPIVARHSFPGGRRFHFVDPNGQELAIWQKD